MSYLLAFVTVKILKSMNFYQQQQVILFYLGIYFMGTGLGEMKVTNAHRKSYIIKR